MQLLAIKTTGIKIIGIFFAALLLGCNVSTKKELELLKQQHTALTQELEDVKTAVDKHHRPYAFDNFHITEDRVGIITKGMRITDLYALLPKAQLKKKVGYGEFANDTYDEYEIYDADGKMILIITPNKSGDLNAKISRIIILDRRYETTEKIGLASTFGELAQVYLTDRFLPDVGQIILPVTHLNARFTIKTTTLLEGWWDGNKVDKSKIPAATTFDRIIIWWKEF